MVRKELIGKTGNGIEYIKGTKRVIFENGVVMDADEFRVASSIGTLNNLLLDYRFDPNKSGFDYAYCKSTGVIRRKAVQKKREEVTVEIPVPEKTEEVPDERAENVAELQKPEFSTEKISVNVFDLAYPVLMLIISVFCSILSIYFTGVYMQNLQPKVIAYCVSVCMLLYGLVGSQMARRAFHDKHYIKGFIFVVTSFCVIGFSMYTSLDVNYSRYVKSHSIVVEASEVKQNNNTEYELLQDELKDNKEQIERLSKTYVVMWDSERKTNVIVEGKITEKAQNTINELTARNKEINIRLIELAREGTRIESTESEAAKNIPDLVGAILHLSGNIVQMLILLLPSIFIDLVNILSITIYNDRYEREED